MRSLALLLSLVAFSAACTDTPPLQVDVEDLSLTIVSGDGQEGLVNQELPQPLTVLIETTKGKKTEPAGGVVVNFVVTVGGGRVYAGTGVTDADGLASDYWTLGPAPGPQELEVRAVDGDGTKHLYETFHALAVLPKTAKPVVASPIYDGATAVAGTAEADATVVVFVDGSQVGTALADGSGSWSLSGLTPLSIGQQVMAVATAPGKAPSDPSDPVTVVAQPKTARPVVASPIYDGATAVAGTAEADATVVVFVDGSQVGTALADGSGSWSLSGLTPLSIGQQVMAVATAPGKAPSDPSDPVTVTSG